MRVINLSPHEADKRVYSVVVHFVVKTPDSFNDRAARDHHTGAAHQKLKQPKFRRSQINLATAILDGEIYQAAGNVQRRTDDFLVPFASVMFPVRLGIVGQLCVPFVCRSSSGSMGDGDRTSRLTVGQLAAFRDEFPHADSSGSM
jgi:hypothetical protein